ncbi:MAG: hypothetical protein ACYC26_05375 [Phycisphaerales bacterium]
MNPTLTQSPPSPLHQRLTALADKYAVPLPVDCRLTDSPQSPPHAGTLLLPGWAICDQPTPQSHLRPLLPWREERRFVELRNIVRQRTIEHVCMWRSRWLAPAGTLTLRQAIYREIGVCQWVLGSPATSVFAAIRGDAAANVILRLADGAACGIEIGRAPAGVQTSVDRHEAIAQRGVASDQVVDCEVRPGSLYVLTDSTTTTYTDVDHELFGLNEQQTAIVRAAFAALQNPRSSSADRAEHEQLARLTSLAIESDRVQRRLDVAPAGGAA